MKWLNIVAKHHKEYVRIVESFGEYFYAEDIVQEAYERAIRYRRSYNGAEFDKWLNTILNNCLRDNRNM